MKIAIPQERRANEPRVAASPEVVKKLIGLGFQVVIEKDAGLAASYLEKYARFRRLYGALEPEFAAALSGKS